MEKNMYEKPEMEVVSFEAEDIITTSGIGGGNYPGDNDGEWSGDY